MSAARPDKTSSASQAPTRELSETQTSPPTPTAKAADEQLDTPTAPPSVPDYELFRKIGSGGQGEVWLGRNRFDQQYYAVKIFPRDAIAEIHGLQQYKGRVKEHPHLIHIEHVGEAGDIRYYIMPLADDARGASPVGDLEQYEALSLRRYLDRQGRLDLDEVLLIGRQMLDAIAHLHRQGGRHGDVKPGNILKVSGRWQLADHGLVTNAENSFVMGRTPDYCPDDAPEDRTADLYALGVTLFEIASGKEPSWIRQLVEDRLTLPGDDPRRYEFLAFLKRACAREPSSRFRNARDMAEALEKLTGTRSHIGLTARRRNILVGGTIGVVAALALVLGIMPRFVRTPSPVQNPSAGTPPSQHEQPPVLQPPLATAGPAAPPLHIVSEWGIIGREGLLTEPDRPVRGRHQVNIYVESEVAGQVHLLYCRLLAGGGIELLPVDPEREAARCFVVTHRGGDMTHVLTYQLTERPGRYSFVVLLSTDDDAGLCGDAVKALNSPGSDDLELQLAKLDRPGLARATFPLTLYE